MQKFISMQYSFFPINISIIRYNSNLYFTNVKIHIDIIFVAIFAD